MRAWDLSGLPKNLLQRFNVNNLCRYIFIQNAAHGLHDNGFVNMRLLTCLFWMLLTTQVTIAATFMPLTQMMDKENSYPENIIFGQICLCQKLPKSISIGIVAKYRLNGIIFPIVYGSLIVFWYVKIQAIVKTQCSTFKTFGCYGGKYRRNLQTFKENLLQSAYWICFIVLENVLVVLLRMYSEGIGEDNIFLIYNIYFVIFGDISIGILLPLKYLMLSKKKYQILWMSTIKQEDDIEKPNYVSTKIPRRETTPEMLSELIESSKNIRFDTSNLKNNTDDKFSFLNNSTIPRVTVVEIN